MKIERILDVEKALKRMNYYEIEKAMIKKPENIVFPGFFIRCSAIPHCFPIGGFVAFYSLCATNTS